MKRQPVNYSCVCFRAQLYDFYRKRTMEQNRSNDRNNSMVKYFRFWGCTNVTTYFERSINFTGEHLDLSQYLITLPVKEINS